LSLAELYRRGHDINWGGFYSSLDRRRLSLPTYPFERRRFWLDDDAPPSTAENHCRLDKSSGVSSSIWLPDIQFETTYSLARFEYLNDHRIHGTPVLPLTFGLRALRDAARQHFGTDNAEIANPAISASHGAARRRRSHCAIILTPADDATAEFRLMSINSEPTAAWQTHMVA
jgi:acyl transferase domain-containing protein